MKNKPSYLHLFGNPEENFYTLGKKDKDSYAETIHQISMLCARNEGMGKVIKLVTDLTSRHKKRYTARHLKELEAYAQGVEKPLNEVLFALLLPEVVAAFNKWLPNLMSIIPGCSSLFLRDDKNGGVIHGRILDYALSGPFEKNERTILYDFDDRYKTFSLGSSGLVYPSLTSINEKGLTMALHYKHGRYFNKNGESIFTITEQLISECSNIREAIKFIKNKESISYWGIYLSDANNEVASIDIRGTEIYQEKFDMNDHQYLYFNNRPLLSQKDAEGIQPYGNLNQCQARKEIIKNNCKKFNSSESKNIMHESMKLLSKNSKLRKANNAKKYQMSPTNLSSIQVCSMSSQLNKFSYIMGQAPKNIKQGIIDIDDLFNTPRFKISTKSRPLDNIEKSQYYLARYQSYLDLGLISDAYHCIQMSLELQKEHEEYFISKFYFLMTQYIYEKDPREFTYILQNFESLKEKLPEYLEDHRKLFVMRLSKILGHGHSYKSSDIQNQYLKKRFIGESSLNSITLKGLKYLIFPRIEILDVIYAY